MEHSALVWLSSLALHCSGATTSGQVLHRVMTFTCVALGPQAIVVGLLSIHLICALRGNSTIKYCHYHLWCAVFHLFID